MVSLNFVSLINTAVTKPKIPAKTKDMAVRKKRAGHMVGLKKPSQKLLVSSQSPGVSMKPIIPLIKNKDSHANTK